ncbi:hypothetical protein OH76DRAFT_732833 [Lentinus brumalis]|uniref:Uncharacterized protein n=1 Tax=Lentinus brumalis TaxID=2498619 RepID=A0A371DS17_9APHY|nr:hypothetical protein OH76DRAFT_732833 [Polyporus brumalis]
MQTLHIHTTRTVRSCALEHGATWTQPKAAPLMLGCVVIRAVRATRGRSGAGTCDHDDGTHAMHMNTGALTSVVMHPIGPCREATEGRRLSQLLLINADVCSLEEWHPSVILSRQPGADSRGTIPVLRAHGSRGRNSTRVGRRSRPECAGDIIDALCLLGVRWCSKQLFRRAAAHVCHVGRRHVSSFNRI